MSKVVNGVALIGFDDYDWMKVTNPPVSVVQQPSFEMGEQAVRILLDRIENGTQKEGEQIWLSTQFVRRQSI